MNGMNMEPEFGVCRMTLQNIVQTRDLSYPLQVNFAGKDDKDFSEMCPDASAAFLGPNLWDDCKMNLIDIDSFLGSNVENNRQPILENLGSNVSAQRHHSLHVPEVPNAHVPDMCPAPQSPAECPLPIDSAPMQNYPEMHDDGRQSYSVDCKFSPNDLALATPPGQRHYNPASRVFPEDELKPQPIVKKSRKNFVPDDLKDDKYWARRHKNNIAAKRSREARRFKENQIVLRASYLEKENNNLKEDVIRLQAENDMLKEKIKKYEL